MRIYSIGTQHIASHMFHNIPIVHASQIDSSVDLVVFPGGADISPSLYGEKPHPSTRYSKETDDRDIQAFLKARKYKIPMLGICRGAQFLTVMAGGKLIQNVSNHESGTHRIFSSMGYDTIQITSSHHQMMYPYNLPEDEYEVIYHSARYSMQYGGDNGSVHEMMTQRNLMEPEIVYYPGIKSFCIQGHPEWMAKDGDVVKLLRKLILQKLRLMPVMV